MYNYHVITTDKRDNGYDVDDCEDDHNDDDNDDYVEDCHLRCPPAKIIVMIMKAM